MSFFDFFAQGDPEAEGAAAAARAMEPAVHQFVDDQIKAWQKRGQEQAERDLAQQHERDSFIQTRRASGMSEQQAETAWNKYALNHIDIENSPAMGMVGGGGIIGAVAPVGERVAVGLIGRFFGRFAKAEAEVPIGPPLTDTSKIFSMRESPEPAAAEPPPPEAGPAEPNPQPPTSTPYEVEVARLNNDTARLNLERASLEKNGLESGTSGTPPPSSSGWRGVGGRITGSVNSGLQSLGKLGTPLAGTIKFGARYINGINPLSKVIGGTGFSNTMWRWTTGASMSEVGILGKLAHIWGRLTLADYTLKYADHGIKSAITHLPPGPVSLASYAQLKNSIAATIPTGVLGVVNAAHDVGEMPIRFFTGSKPDVLAPPAAPAAPPPPPKPAVTNPAPSQTHGTEGFNFKALQGKTSQATSPSTHMEVATNMHRSRQPLGAMTPLPGSTNASIGALAKGDPVPVRRRTMQPSAAPGMIA